MKRIEADPVESAVGRFLDSAKHYQRYVQVLKDIQQKPSCEATERINLQLISDLHFVDEILDTIEQIYGQVARSETYYAYISQDLSIKQVAELLAVNERTVRRRCRRFIRKAAAVYILECGGTAL